MNDNLKNSRRRFIKGSLLALGGISIVPRHVLGKGYLAPSDHLTKGIIGVGGMGRGHFQYAGTKTVAICDVDQRHLKIAMEALKDPGVKTFTDYRELIRLAGVDIVQLDTHPLLSVIKK